MKELVKNNKHLVALFSIYLIAGIFILMYFQKGGFELWVNRHHQPLLDIFFYYITYLGDGYGNVLLLLIIFMFNAYHGILSCISLLLSTAIVQFMKRYLFSDYPRPVKFFGKSVQLHVVENLELHVKYSFPSGHSSGAFSIFIILCLVSKQRSWSTFYFVLAVCVAFSRVYLMQHFFMDTYVGAIIGTLTSVLVYLFMSYRSSLAMRDSLQKPLFGIFDRQ